MKTPPDDFDADREAQGDARLEALLREPVAEVSDDGFSARVLTALPPRQHAKMPWSRTTFCAVAALMGSLAAVAATAIWGDWATTWQPVQDNFGALNGTLGDLNVLVGLVVAAGSVVYAWRFVPRSGRA